LCLVDFKDIPQISSSIWENGALPISRYVKGVASRRWGKDATHASSKMLFGRCNQICTRYNSSITVTRLDCSNRIMDTIYRRRTCSVDGEASIVILVN